MFKSVMQLTVFSFLLSLLAFAYSLPIAIRDVYVPPVTSPTTGTIWPIGTQQNVTWDTSNPPASITNKQGQVVLAKSSLLDVENPLASGFDILQGWVTVTVPDVQPGDDYTIVLFGDSGNDSEVFSIVSSE
ncbi:hypothetical protein LXA43DRAFT_522629 [Ganoderma leucocontextum]|nr:hypothetical protein LXA43DRAFT_522629 [Ganoderma leucocontextum]